MLFGQKVLQLMAQAVCVVCVCVCVSQIYYDILSEAGSDFIDRRQIMRRSVPYTHHSCRQPTDVDMWTTDMYVHRRVV
jgi:hypothetical protein